MASDKKSKGGRPSKAKLVIGKKFGHLTVVGFSHMKASHSYLFCECDCENKSVVTRAWKFLASSRNLNCGCVPWVNPRRVTKEHRQAKLKAWESANRDKMRDRYKEWRKANWSTLVIKKMAWKAANPDKVSKIAKRFREAHPDRVRAGQAVYRARKMKATVGDTAVISAWEATWKRKKWVTCYWCQNSFLPSACHTDHVIALRKDGSHEVGNLVISCAPCNLRKNSMSVEEWNARIDSPVLL